VLVLPAPRQAAGTQRKALLAHGPENADRAAEQYRAALALATDLGMRRSRPSAIWAWATCTRRIDRVDDARVELSAAIALLGDLGMARWLPEARAELAGAHH